MTALIIGALSLARGSAGLPIVRLTNPRLKGLDWLGGSFAAGSAGAILLSIQQRRSLFFLRTPSRSSGQLRPFSLKTSL
jgi:hypothetical protein